MKITAIIAIAGLAHAFLFLIAAVTTHVDYKIGLTDKQATEKKTCCTTTKVCIAAMVVSIIISLICVSTIV